MKSKVLQSVIDDALGEIYFPAGDNVMAPTIAATGMWEEKEINWLKSNVSNGNHCINVGANVGYFSIWLGKLAGPRGSVVSFEPNPELMPAFKLNIRNSKLKNIKLIKAAVGNRTGFQWLFLNQKNYGDSRMFDPRITSGGGNYIQHGFSRIPKRRLVRIVELDRVIDHKIDVILIDTQGYDHQVLRGMKSIIEQCKPKVLTEFVPQWLIDIGEDPAAVLDEYVSWGYDVGSVDFEIPVGASSKDILDRIAITGHYYTNLTLT